MANRWVVATLLTISWTPLEGQQPGSAGYDFMPGTFLPSGQPIVPIFEGWYPNSDGTYGLCFGYWSGNTEETLSIPLGSDNVIEPRQYDGSQPTLFRPRPRTGWRRHYCTFVIDVPADWGSQDVIWTVGNHGETYAAVGHLTVPSYMLDEPVAAGRASSIPEDEPWDSRAGYGSWQGAEAPLLQFVEPGGPEGIGRSGVTAGPVTVRVGQPLTLRVRVGTPDGRDARWWVGWWEHQGPGTVTIGQREMEADPTTDYLATTTATFDEPGNYVIALQAIESIQSFERFCCWTNGYVEVTVTR